MKLILNITLIISLLGCAHKSHQDETKKTTTRQINTNSTALNINWVNNSSDSGATKFLNTNLINTSNVSKMKVAWTNYTNDNAIVSEKALKVGINQATPIFINNILYTTTALNQVTAMNPATGEVIWNYNPQLISRGANPPNSGFIHRGPSYWTDGSKERIIIGTSDYYLISIDAKTGQPDAGFGANGSVDLMTTLTKKSDRNLIGVSSPVAICKNF